MLTARPAGMWSRRYLISADGASLATWEPSMWGSGGFLDLGGRRYVVQANMWGTKYGMKEAHGPLIAAADRVGRKDWSVEASGQTYHFRRASLWRHEEALHAQGRAVGFVKRPSLWRRDVVADMPGLPLPVQTFVLIVALTKWDSANASAAGGAAATGAIAAG
jgi:hypothetical protein